MIGLIILCFFLVIFTCITWIITRMFEKVGLGFIILSINFFIMLGAIATQFEGYSINGGSVTAGFELLLEWSFRKLFLVLAIVQFITSLIALNQKEKNENGADKATELKKESQEKNEKENIKQKQIESTNVKSSNLKKNSLKTHDKEIEDSLLRGNTKPVIEEKPKKSCPHCKTENGLDAKRCFICGKKID